MIAHHREFVDRSMTTLMTPYRQPGQIEIHEKTPVIKTGLIPFVPPPPPHRCDQPFKHTIIEIQTKKFWFFFKKRKEIKKEKDVLEGSLYRCPECFKVYIFQKEAYGHPKWARNKRAADEWLDKTGEYVDGES